MDFLIFIIAAFLGVLLDAFVVTMYFFIPRMLTKQFMLCFKCASAHFNNSQEKGMPFYCKKCQIPMDLITIPEKFYLYRVKLVRKLRISLIPLFGMIFLLMWELWIGIAVTILYLIIIGSRSYVADQRSKEEIISWAFIHFERTSDEIDDRLVYSFRGFEF